MYSLLIKIALFIFVLFIIDDEKIKKFFEKSIIFQFHQLLIPFLYTEKTKIIRFNSLINFATYYEGQIHHISTKKEPWS